METKVVLDGTLFSECEMHGTNRDGMMRLAEEITKRLILDSGLDISFASTLYIEKYDTALKKFVADNYPTHKNRILSKKPPLITNKLLWKRNYRTQLTTPILSTIFKETFQNDIFHSFYYPFANSISKGNVKSTITYLDIIPLKLKGSSARMIQRTKNVVRSIVKNYAISISEFSKQDLLNYDKRVVPEKVFVVPLAASEELFYQNKNEENWKFVQLKYGLPDRYFLCVAGNDHRKNILHVVKCFNQFVLQEKPNDIYLVLTGNTTHSSAILNTLNLSKAVMDKIFLPTTFIDSNDLAVLYSNALCFFFMSTYEGFGLPALESMQCGTPTVASNTTSLPEVVGNGGILLPPLDENALAEVMCKIYANEQYRNNLSLAGLQQAKNFSWEKTANEYTRIFKQLASNQL